MANSCEHFESLRTVVEPTSSGCDRCIVSGDGWVHLRSCLQCGLVGCCDNSVNRHARRHWEETGHTLIASIEPGESWRYCFPDQVVSG